MFKVRTAEFNTPNLENLYSTLNVYNPYKMAVINITPEQILNLSEPLMLLPPPGVNNYYVITSMSLSLNYNSIPYTQTGGVETVGIFYGTGIDNEAFNLNGVSASIFDSFSSISTSTQGNPGIQNASFSDITDTGIYLVSENGLYLQTGNSPIKLTIYYTINSV